MTRSGSPLRRRGTGACDPWVAGALLEWFRREARELPWRRTLDPYAIWVSEIMLQQTQVKTVIPYWERWMAALPRLRDLAAARPGKVLKLWEGLGYYSRARNLQAAAREVVTRHGGEFPRSFEEVLALPGIGRYTAGAICSIAFNQQVPILDGNVIRVLARVGALRGDPRERGVNEELWSRAASLVEAAAALPPSHAPGLAGNCSALNQSLMELGALVCTPRGPVCDRCPVSARCTARELGAAEVYPEIPVRAKGIAKRVMTLVLERGGRVLVERQPAGGVNAGLWQFPSREMVAGSTPSEFLQSCHPVDPSPELRPLVTVRHSITRYRIELRAFHARVASALSGSGVPKGECREWITPRQAAGRAFSSAHARVLKAWIGKGGG